MGSQEAEPESLSSMQEQIGLQAEGEKMNDGKGIQEATMKEARK